MVAATKEDRITQIETALLDTQTAISLLRQKFPRLPEAAITQLAYHVRELAEQGAARKTAAWIHGVAPTAVEDAFSWISDSNALTPQEHTGDLALRLAGALGKRVREYRQRVERAHANSSTETQQQLSAHDYAFFWPHPLANDTEAPVAAAEVVNWILSVQWRQSPENLARHLRTIVENWDVITKSHPELPSGITEALQRRTASTLNGPGAGALFSQAYAAAGAPAAHYEDTFAAYLSGIATPRLPLPTASYTYGAYTGTFLNREDPQGLLLGEYTNCCQKIGGAGAGAARHGQANPRGGYFAVKDSAGRIVAQSWTWLAVDSAAWCFDNIEVLKGSENQKPSGMEKRYADIANIYQQAAQGLARLTGLPVTVGEGFVPPELLAHFAALPSDMPAALIKELPYTDARTQRLVAAPPPETPIWKLETGSTAATSTWVSSNGTVITAAKEWNRDQPLTTKVTVNENSDSVTAGGLSVALSIAGAGALEVRSMDGKVLIQGASSEQLALEALIGSVCENSALDRAAQHQSNPLDMLALATLHEADLTQLLGSGLAASELADGVRRGIPLALLSEALRDGTPAHAAWALLKAGAHPRHYRTFSSTGTFAQALELLERRGRLEEYPDFIAAGGTHQQALYVLERGGLLMRVSPLLRAGLTFEQIVAIATGRGDLTGARHLVDLGYGYPDIIAKVHAGQDLVLAAVQLERSQCLDATPETQVETAGERTSPRSIRMRVAATSGNATRRSY